MANQPVLNKAVTHVRDQLSAKAMTYKIGDLQPNVIEKEKKDPSKLR